MISSAFPPLLPLTVEYSRCHQLAGLLQSDLEFPDHDVVQGIWGSILPSCDYNKLNNREK
ncbi:hypothetical protein T10_8320 [Trichinella papuae]|uniref:Uncharacterized protein n=1 Tax=Trichinella papuae TaxID=268474 RepID=A0A0V1M3C3_9BILA|nr:hypothetical protein T10_8320 [Trichinella papuae]